MVKSRSNKTRLKVNNDLDPRALLLFNNTSISKRKKSLRMSAAMNAEEACLLVTRQRQSGRLLKIFDICDDYLKRFCLKTKHSIFNAISIHHILINGKRVPANALEMSPGSKFKEVVMC